MSIAHTMASASCSYGMYFFSGSVSERLAYTKTLSLPSTICVRTAAMPTLDPSQCTSKGQSHLGKAKQMGSVVSLVLSASKAARCLGSKWILLLASRGFWAFLPVSSYRGAASAAKFGMYFR